MKDETAWKNKVSRKILNPKDCASIVAGLTEPIWVYSYQHQVLPWRFSIATHLDSNNQSGIDKASQSARLSLGGLRIVPKERAALPGFNPDREAIELARGMEEKVAWSRRVGVAGPLGIKQLSRIVGGKCVLQLAEAARVGEARDFEALDFALYCLHDFTQSSGVQPITGQDLGHGLMSDGRTASLDYLHEHFPGSIISDTSIPTAEGNYYMLKGMLRSIGRQLSGSKIGLIGLGNIGAHVLKRLHAEGSEIHALEFNAEKREKYQNLCKEVFEPSAKERLLGSRLDALVVNANAGSLDDRALQLINANPGLKVVCGCENLAMPNPQGEELLRRGNKMYCHTELCGMMGYLTAVEEFLSRASGQKFGVRDMEPAASLLEDIGFKAGRLQVEREFALSFSDAVRSIYSQN